MVIFNAIQIFKSSIRRIFVKKGVGDTAQNDIELLSAMCEKSDFMRASNGGIYWYYLTWDVEDLPVAEYLLNRNGIVPEFRMSRYRSVCGESQPLLRLSQSYLLKHSELYNFVKQVKVSSEDASIRQQILNIRNQMRQK